MTSSDQPTPTPIFPAPGSLDATLEMFRSKRAEATASARAPALDAAASEAARLAGNAAMANALRRATEAPATQPTHIVVDLIPETLLDGDPVADRVWREARMELARAAIADPLGEMRDRLERSRHISVSRLSDARSGVELAEVELCAADARLAAIDAAIRMRQLPGSASVSARDLSQVPPAYRREFLWDDPGTRAELVAAFLEWQREATRTGVSPVVGIEAADPEAVAEGCADFLLNLLRGEG